MSVRSVEAMPLPNREINGGLELLLGGLACLLALAESAGAAGEPARAVGAVVFGLYGLVVVLLGVRTLRCAVLVSGDGILVRNLLRTYRLAWSEVHSVLLPYEGINGAKVRILCTDRRAIPCRAVSPASRMTRRALQTVERHQRRLQRSVARATRVRRRAVT